jgi:hypothetical protein
MFRLRTYPTKGMNWLLLLMLLCSGCHIPKDKDELNASPDVKIFRLPPSLSTRMNWLLLQMLGCSARLPPWFCLVVYSPTLSTRPLWPLGFSFFRRNRSTASPHQVFIVSPSLIYSGKFPRTKWSSIRSNCMGSGGKVPHLSQDSDCSVNFYLKLLWTPLEKSLLEYVNNI